jgi:hypothetical protein
MPFFHYFPLRALVLIGRKAPHANSGRDRNWSMWGYNCERNSVAL